MSFFARFLRSARPALKTPFDAGVDALERSRFDEALAQFAIALASAAGGSERALVHNKRALVFLRKGDRPSALAAFVDALEANWSCAPAIVNVGNLLLEDGAVDEAIAHYEAALRIDDAYAPAHLNLGIAFKRLGRRADAVRSFRRANRLEAGASRRRR